MLECSTKVSSDVSKLNDKYDKKNAVELIEVHLMIHKWIFELYYAPFCYAIRCNEIVMNCSVHFLLKPIFSGIKLIPV